MIFKRIVSLFLILTVSVPIVTDVHHLLHGHEHTKCNETKLHIHKYENKCEVCDHNLVTFKYDLNNDIEEIRVYYFKTILLLIDSLYITPNYNTFLLRAPPAFHFL